MASAGQTRYEGGAVAPTIGLARSEAAAAEAATFGGR
jgi:hypothetical protein